ncbi:MAG: hypothetical protein EBR67_11320, partial [Proteobacteria bacterium]|nr:hypothetical protein [Pseudomonadota bacterium]
MVYYTSYHSVKYDHMQISKSFKERIKNITIPMLPEAYSDGVPHTFIPWEANLSPSALYNCSVACRKAAGHKTPELKWVSVKRWVNITPAGVTLPNGCFLSVKRRETFEAMPRPKFIKQDYVLLLMPYGNLFYWNNEGDP